MVAVVVNLPFWTVPAAAYGLLLAGQLLDDALSRRRHRRRREALRASRKVAG